MCSIFGVIGHEINETNFQILKQSAGDRGRDGGRVEEYRLNNGLMVRLGNWRATPTPEEQKAPLQPYGQMVHNGTIANDAELGRRDGEVDSMVLARILDRTSLKGLRESLQRVRGSFALACLTENDIYLACNYKPIYFWKDWHGAVYFSSLARHFQGICPYGSAPVQMNPYSVMALLTGAALPLPRLTAKRALVVCSAGLDSTTVATILVAKGWETRLLHFRYGCRAQGPEVQRIPLIAQALGVDYEFLSIDYSSMGNSPLLDQNLSIAGGIEGAEYAHEWVPARNFVMLALASAYAESNGFHVIALGNNLEEAGAYPDNEEEFYIGLNRVLNYAVRSNYELNILQPVGHLMKHEIVAKGLALGAPYQYTWSCYRGGDQHCGECGPCFMRRIAFERNGEIDPVMSN